VRIVNLYDPGSVGPIGSFYNQVNDTGSKEPLVNFPSNFNAVFFSRKMIILLGY